MERSLVALAPQVQLQRLPLHDRFARYVGDADGGEVGLPGHRAHAGELRRLATNLVVPARMRIGQGYEVTGRLARQGSGSVLPEHPVHLGAADRAEALSSLASVGHLLDLALELTLLSALHAVTLVIRHARSLVVRQGLTSLRGCDAQTGDIQAQKEGAARDARF